MTAGGGEFDRYFLVFHYDKNLCLLHLPARIHRELAVLPVVRPPLALHHREPPLHGDQEHGQQRRHHERHRRGCGFDLTGEHLNRVTLLLLEANVLLHRLYEPERPPELLALLFIPVAPSRRHPPVAQVRHLRGDGDALALEPRPNPRHNLIYRGGFVDGDGHQGGDHDSEEVPGRGRRQAVRHAVRAKVQTEDHTCREERGEEEDGRIEFHPPPPGGSHVSHGPPDQRPTQAARGVLQVDHHVELGRLRRAPKLPKLRALLFFVGIHFSLGLGLGFGRQEIYERLAREPDHLAERLHDFVLSPVVPSARRHIREISQEHHDVADE